MKIEKQRERVGKTCSKGLRVGLESRPLISGHAACGCLLAHWAKLAPLSYFSLMLNNQTYNTDYCTRCQDTITGLQDRQKENTEFSFVLFLEERKLTFHIALIKVCTQSPSEMEQLWKLYGSASHWRWNQWSAEANYKFGCKTSCMTLKEPHSKS